MPGTRHILVVDDDSGLQPRLRTAGAPWISRLCGPEWRPHDANLELGTDWLLVVLDIMMPGEDGLSLCRRLLGQGSNPIIMLTAVGGEVDRIVGLEMGADDYLAKPFNPRELLARIRAVLRRSRLPGFDPAVSAERVFEFGRWRLDAARRRLQAASGALVDLRTAEFDLLMALVEHPRRRCSPAISCSILPGAQDAINFDRSIDVYISRLRRRIRGRSERAGSDQDGTPGGLSFRWTNHSEWSALVSRLQSSIATTIALTVLVAM